MTEWSPDPTWNEFFVDLSRPESPEVLLGAVYESTPRPPVEVLIWFGCATLAALEPETAKGVAWIFDQLADPEDPDPDPLPIINAIEELWGMRIGLPDLSDSRSAHDRLRATSPSTAGHLTLGLDGEVSGIAIEESGFDAYEASVRSGLRLRALGAICASAFQQTSGTIRLLHTLDQSAIRYQEDVQPNQEMSAETSAFVDYEKAVCSALVAALTTIGTTYLEDGFQATDVVAVASHLCQVFHTGGTSNGK